MERNIKLQCYAVTISPEEIRRNIPISVMTEIKNKNPSPYFRAYSVMHEGTARPRVIGEENALPTYWGRQVIRAAKNVIRRGVQFFIGHNADNSTAGRKSIGEVVATFTKSIGDKLHNIAIGYFPEKFESDKYNVCSIEGDVMTQDMADHSIIQAVKKVSGIALGNDSQERPAFPGAVYLASLQAFDDNEDHEDPPSNKNKTVRKSRMEITFDDIKRTVRDRNIHVDQLYTEDEIKKDRTFEKSLSDAVKTATENMIPKEEHEKLLNEKVGEIDKLTKSVSLATAHDKLKNSYPEGLTDSQKTFIENNFNKKKESMEDFTDEGIKKFVDNSISEYSEYAKLFNANPEPGKPVNDPDKSSDDEPDQLDEIINEVVETPQGE